MAFVDGCAHDIFISYAHLDNERTKWIETLHTLLEQRLAEKLGSPVSIWRDPRLDGTSIIPEAIADGIRSSAVFVAVVTPRYVQSPSCREEFTAFHAVARPVGTRSCLVRVLKTKLSGDLVEAPELQPRATLGFPFFDDKAASDDDEFDNRSGSASYPRFEAQVFAMAAAIVKLLHELRNQRQRAASLQPKIFLASTVGSLSPFREKVRRELDGSNYELAPEVKLSEEGVLDTAVMQDAMQNAKISIHLLGGAYGTVPEGQERSLPHLSYDCAKSAGLRQLVWVASHVQPVEKRTQELIETINHEETAGIEIFEGSFEAFKEALFDILKTPPPAAPLPAAAGKSVYLVFSKDDIHNPPLQEIHRCLLNQGIPVQLPVFEAEPGELRSIEEEHVINNEATLIYYGTAKDVWVDNKRRVLINMLSKSGRCDKYRRALYLDAPPSEAKKLTSLNFSIQVLNDNKQGLTPLLVLGDCETFTQEKLKPLVDWLRAS